MVKEPFYKSVNKLRVFKVKNEASYRNTTLVFLAINYEKSVIPNFLSKT